MILDIYKDAFSYAGQDIKTLLKLGLLSFFSFLIIPEFLVMGYEYRIMGIAINGMVDGDDKLPKFDNFTGMLVDGLKVFFVEIVYMIVPAVVLAIAFALGSTNGAASGILLIVAVILFIIAILYSFLAIPNMIANEGSFKSAFDFKRLNEIIKMIGVFKYVVFCIGVSLITCVISAVVFLILMVIMTILGITAVAINPMGASAVMVIWGIILTAIFSFIVTPYLGIFASRAYGLIYGVGE